MYKAKVVIFAQRWLYKGIVVVFGKVVVFGQKMLYSGILVIFVYFCCIRIEWFYSRKSCFIRAKWLYLGKSCCFGTKIVVLRHSGFKLESGCILAKLLYSG